MAIVDIALDAELRTAFLNVEASFLIAVSEDDQRIKWKAEFDRHLYRAQEAMSNRLISPDTTKVVHSVVRNIWQISSVIKEKCDVSAHVRNEQVARWDRVLRSQLPVRNVNVRSPKHSVVLKSQKQHHLADLTAEMTRFRPCRDYFLSHLGTPYPSASDKKRMANQIGCEVASVSQWFTNHRRRSNWMTIMKEHAENDKAVMQKLVQAVVSPDASVNGAVVSDDARMAILSVQAYFEKITAPTVSEEFMEMVSQPPMSDEELAAYRARRKQIRRVRMETKRAFATKLGVKHQKSAQGAELVVQAAPSAGKRKRCSEDAPPGENGRPMKKRNTSAQLRLPVSHNHNVRYLVKADGTVRRLRRKILLQAIGHNIPMAGKTTVPNAPKEALSSKAIPLHAASLKINKKRKAIDNCGEAMATEPRLPTTHKRRRTSPTPFCKAPSVASSCSSSPPSSSRIPLEQRSASTPHVSAAIPVETEWNRMVSAPPQLPSFPQNVDSSDDNLISASQVNAYLASMGIPVAPGSVGYGPPQGASQSDVAFSEQQAAFVPSYTHTQASTSEFVISPNFLPVSAYDTLSQSSSALWSPSSESVSTAATSFADSTFIEPNTFSIPQASPLAPVSQEALQQMIEAERRAYEAKVQALQAQLALAQAAAQGL